MLGKMSFGKTLTFVGGKRFQKITKFEDFGSERTL